MWWPGNCNFNYQKVPTFNHQEVTTCDHQKVAAFAHQRFPTLLSPKGVNLSIAKRLQPVIAKMLQPLATKRAPPFSYQRVGLQRFTCRIVATFNWPKGCNSNCNSICNYKLIAILNWRSPDSAHLITPNKHVDKLNPSLAPSAFELTRFYFESTHSELEFDFEFEFDINFAKLKWNSAQIKLNCTPFVAIQKGVMSETMPETETAWIPCVRFL